MKAELKPEELRWLEAIKKDPGQYFVLRHATKALLKKKLIRHDIGGYLRITEAGNELIFNHG